MSGAEKLREAARVERAEWSGDVGGKFDKAARIHLALADLLEEVHQRVDTYNATSGLNAAAFRIADAILGGAS